MFWSHWQNVGRNELRTSSSVAALGIWVLPLPLQEWSLAYRSDEPDLHLLLSATRTSRQSLGPFLAPFRITGLSHVWRDLWDRIPQKRRKMSVGDGSTQNPSLLQRWYGLWSPLNSWDYNHVDPLLGHYFVPFVIGQLLCFLSRDLNYIPFYIQLYFSSWFNFFGRKKSELFFGLKTITITRTPISRKTTASQLLSLVIPPDVIPSVWKTMPLLLWWP